MIGTGLLTFYFIFKSTDSNESLYRKAFGVPKKEICNQS